MEDAAVAEGRAEQRLGQVLPIVRSAMEEVEPEIPEGNSPREILGIAEAAVRKGLERGRHEQQPGLGTWVIQRHQFDGPHAAEAGLADHVEMSAGILALRRAEHDARMTGTVLKPGLGSHDLVPRPMLLHTGEINVMEGMRAQLEGGTQLADLPGRHRLGVGRQRHVEGPLQIGPMEHLGHAEIERMSIVPACRDQRCRDHVSPLPLDRASVMACR